MATNAGPQLLTHLDRHVIAGAVGPKEAPGQWRCVPYRTDGFEGVLLGCGEATRPGPVTLRLGVTGLHRIWLGLHAPFSGGHVRVRLTDDLCCQAFAAPDHSVIEPPVMHEMFWKEVDLSGQDLVLEAVHYRGRPLPGALAFVRLEPIDKEDEPANPDVWRPLVVTNDGSGVFRSMPHHRPEDLLEQFEAIPDSSCMRVLLWGNGDADNCNYPTQVGSPMYGNGAESFFEDVNSSGVPNMRRWREEGWDSLKVVRDYTRRRGWELHVYIRMEAFADAYPVDGMIGSEFFWAHPEWWCLGREGSRVNRLSYAYPEVQDHMLDLMREILSYEPEGLCLCLIRGIPVVLYESIMVEGFRREHGEDPRCIDELDPRWLDYQASVFTQFVRRVRAAMGADRRLSVMTPGCEPDLRRWGLDVATWVREGMVDDVYPVGQRFNACNTHYDSPDALDCDYFQALDGRERIRLIPCLYPWQLFNADLPAWRELMRSFLDRGADGYCVWDGAASDYHRPGASRHAAIGDIGYADWAGPGHVSEAPPCRKVNVLELNGFRVDYYGTHEVD